MEVEVELEERALLASELARPEDRETFEHTAGRARPAQSLQEQAGRVSHACYACAHVENICCTTPYGKCRM